MLGWVKKYGLFSDIDHISFNTHPPPPNDDIWQEWLSVGKFTTHPPWRNNDIFLKKKVVFDKIFQQVNLGAISALFLLKPSLIRKYMDCKYGNIMLGPTLNYQQFREGFQKIRHDQSPYYKILAPRSSEGVKYNPKSLFWNSDILFRHPPT